MVHKTDAQFRAESDARSLAEANVIRTDRARLSKAKTAAKALAREQQKEVTGMKRVASAKVPAAAKPSGKKR